MNIIKRILSWRKARQGPIDVKVIEEALLEVRSKEGIGLIDRMRAARLRGELLLKELKGYGRGEEKS